MADEPLRDRAQAVLLQAVIDSVEAGLSASALQYAEAWAAIESARERADSKSR